MMTDQNKENLYSSEEPYNEDKYAYRKEYEPSSNDPSGYDENFNQFQPDSEIKIMPNNYMTLSIIATVVGWLLCCCSCGISGILATIGIVFSSQVNSKFLSGDIYGAHSSAKTAKILSIISLVISGLAFFACIIRVIINIITGSIDETLDTYMRMLDEI